MNKRKITYYVSTGLLTLMIGGGATMYFANHAMVVEAFTTLGYPTYLIYPLAVAKLLGLVAIWTRKSPLLKDLAYAGLFYDLILAAAAHIAVQDNEYFPAMIGVVLVAVSYAAQRNAPFLLQKNAPTP